MISDRIYDDIPPQMKILNMVIPILCISAFLYQTGALQAAICRRSSNDMSLK